MIQSKLILIIAGIALATILTLSGSLWWKSNQLERVELRLVNAEQTISNKNAELLQLKNDIDKQERYIKDLNTLQSGYDIQLDQLQKRLVDLGVELENAIVTTDPSKKEQAVINIQDKFDKELINSYNCLMNATGNNNKVCL